MLFDVFFLDVTMFFEGFSDLSIEFLQQIWSLLSIKKHDYLSKKWQLFFSSKIIYWIASNDCRFWIFCRLFVCKYLEFKLLFNVIKFNQVCITNSVELTTHVRDHIFNIIRLNFKHFHIFIILSFQFIFKFFSQMLFPVDNLSEDILLLCDFLFSIDISKLWNSNLAIYVCILPTFDVENWNKFNMISYLEKFFAFFKFLKFWPFHLKSCILLTRRNGFLLDFSNSM